MAFDANKFRAIKWEPATRAVAVPVELQDAFGCESVMVRGLDGMELARMRQAGDNSETVAKLVRDLAAQSAGNDVADKVLQLIGLDPDATPDEIVKHTYAVEHGCTEPVFERDIVIRICKVQPAFFMALASAIMELSAEGYTPGKPKDSGKIRQLGTT